VLNLLERLRRELGLSYVFISHDLGVVKHVSDRVIVMFLGRFCEIAPAEELYAAPFHPYSSELVTSIPNPRAPTTRQRRDELGEPPSPMDPPSGCRFRTRCPRAQALCAEVEPQLRLVGSEHAVACHYPLRPVGDGAPAEAFSSATKKGRDPDD
jgi:oligopeptide/dipeptide ABC transporter ATP-binding protein